VHGLVGREAGGHLLQAVIAEGGDDAEIGVGRALLETRRELPRWAL
jgi:hypothetical protein